MTEITQTQQSKFLWYTGVVAIIFVIFAFGGAAIVQPFRLERYLKPFVIIHIISAMGWLILFTYQSKLALSGRFEKHRKNLKIGTTLVIITTLFSIYITFAWGDARRFIGESRDVLVFAILFFASIWAVKRGRTETHKSLMLIACLNLFNPAFSRLGFIFDWPVSVGVLASFLTWIIVPLSYDLLTKRKVHKATIGGIVFTVTSFALVIGIVFSPLMEKIELFLYG